eukprot:TRINITY_DN746_c0_g2_i1.p2 TRINITY_DN746_c0_g2~~TRINITY_DN746_c0_g2_i1.p2  ORF type:complete len:239 (+),score=2.98 TRINITY_DN746_c0_g2_i1:909-1625(+)
MYSPKKCFTPLSPQGGLYRPLKTWKQYEPGNGWIGNFHLMCSKDNTFYPKYLREYFDTPRQYDVNGSRRQQWRKEGNRIGKMSPKFRRFLDIRIRTSITRKGRRCQSVGGSPRKSQAPTSQDTKSVFSNDKNIRVGTSIGTIQRKPKLTFKRIDLDLYNVWCNKAKQIQLEHGKIPNLRESVDRSPIAKKKEIAWDNKCYRISIQNEIVHRHYRTSFEDIVRAKKYQRGFPYIFTTLT